MLTMVERDRTIVSGYLRRANGPVSEDTVVAETPTFTGHARSFRLGSIPLSAIEDPNRVTIRRDIDRVPHASGATLMGILISGSGWLTTAGRTTPLVRGAIAAYRSDESFELRFDSPYRYLVLEVDDQTLPEAAGLPLAEGAGELARCAGAQVAVDILTGIPAKVERLPPVLREHLAGSVVTLLRSAIDEVRGVRALGPRTDSALIARVIRWIDLHIADPDLSAGRIAGAHHISVRYLHRLFEATGSTLGAHIRQRRIERIKADLLAAPDAPIGVVGARWGLSDPTQLIRQFRAVEGTTPGRWRAAMRGDR